METVPASPSVPSHFPLRPVGSLPSLQVWECPHSSGLESHAHLPTQTHPLAVGGPSLSLLTHPIIKTLCFPSKCALDLFKRFWTSHLRPPANTRKSTVKCSRYPSQAFQLEGRGRFRGRYRILPCFEWASRAHLASDTPRPLARKCKKHPVLSLGL